MSAANRKRGRNEGDGGSGTVRLGSLPVSFDELITPNFEELARQFPEFGRAWKGVKENQKEKKSKGEKSTLSAALTQDFSISLTKALLHVHFRLSLAHVPVDHLTPPAPNRWFYVSWIENTLMPHLRSSDVFEQASAQLSAIPGVVLDIGTGASCIYPLLLAASIESKIQPTRHDLKIYATDADPESVRTAELNVQANPRVQPFIRVLQVPPSATQLTTSHSEQNQLFPKGPLRTSLESMTTEEQTSVDICLTNPPFFDDQTNTERTQRRAGDNRQRTNMTVSEGSYPGGEIGFVSDMIVDGVFLYLNQQTPPGWSSCMCGKKTSWIALKHILEQLLGCAHVCATEFGPGHMTRWFLAWTFEKPRICSPLAQRDQWSFSVQLTCSENTLSDGPCDEVASRIKDYCKELSVGHGPLKVCILPTNTLWHKEITIEEERPKDGVNNNESGWSEDDLLPERFQKLAKSIPQTQRDSLLPQEGHFQILITVKATTQNSQVEVTAQSFCHTRHGKTRAEKIKQQMPGDVGRTNRKWRRRIKREQQTMHETAESHAMDES